MLSERHADASEIVPCQSCVPVVARVGKMTWRRRVCLTKLFRQASADRALELSTTSLQLLQSINCSTAASRSARIAVIFASLSPLYHELPSRCPRGPANRPSQRVPRTAAATRIRRRRIRQDSTLRMNFSGKSLPNQLLTSTVACASPPIDLQIHRCRPSV